MSEYEAARCLLESARASIGQLEEVLSLADQLVLRDLQILSDCADSALERCLTRRAQAMTSLLDQ